jgi:hypothetical protein
MNKIGLVLAFVFMFQGLHAALLMRTDLEKESVGSLPAYMRLEAGKAKITEEKAPNGKPNRYIVLNAQEDTEARLLYTDSAAHADFMMSARLRANASGQCGFVFRWQDARNFSRVTLSVKDKKLTFERVQNGSAKILGNAQVEFLAQSWYTVKLKTKGELSALEINGFEVFRLKEPLLLGKGPAGFWSGPGIETSVDNFIFSTLP